MSQSTQQQLLDAALTLIRQFVPGATSVYLATSDQDIYGFALIDVVTDAGARLSRTEPRLLMNLIDDTYQFLGDLDWDTLVGENEAGDAQIDLPLTPVPPKTEWLCLTCGRSSDALRDDRDAQHLQVDGAHYPNWCTADGARFS